MKVIIACQGTSFPEGAFNFARRLNEIKPILLTGVFLPQASLVNMWSVAAGAGVPLFTLPDDVNEADLTRESIDRFSKLCRDNHIDYRVHHNISDLILPELKKETNFADLLLLGGESFYQQTHDVIPNMYLQDALQHVHCPVVIVPENYRFPERIILAYDGSDDSVFAIKQFAYLLPALCDLPALVVYACSQEANDLPHQIQAEELFARHFSNLGFLKLDIKPKRQFSTWLSEQKDSLLVSGSFGRRGLSLAFRKSFTSDILADHQLPVFIAHR